MTGEEAWLRYIGVVGISWRSPIQNWSELPKAAKETWEAYGRQGVFDAFPDPREGPAALRKASRDAMIKVFESPDF